MDIIPTPKKNIVLDATLTSSFQGCERYVDFRFNRLLVSIEGKSNNLEAGSIVHKVMEVYGRNRINGFDRASSIQSGLAAGEMYFRGCKECTGFIPIDSQLKPQCLHQINEYPGVKNTPYENEGSKTGLKYILQTCEEYFDFYKNDHWVILEVESVKKKLLYEDDEIRVLWKSKLDKLVDTNQGIYPADYKTMKQRRDTNSMAHQFMGQCFVTGARAVWIDKIGFQSSLKPNEKFVRVPVNYSADRLSEWQSEIIPYIAYQYLACVENQQWPPRFTHCENKYGNCEFYNHGVCNGDRGMREENLRMNFEIGEVWDPVSAE